MGNLSDWYEGEVIARRKKAPASDAQPEPVEKSQKELIREQIKQQQDQIDQMLAKNKERWAAERQRDTYTGSMGMFAQPSQYYAGAIPKEQKQAEAAHYELDRARKALDTYTEADQAEDIRQGKEKRFYIEALDGIKNTTFAEVADIATLGFASTQNQSKINAALEKASQGKQLTEIEQLIVDARAATENAERYVADRGGATAWHSIGQSLPGTAQFMAETAATGGMAGVGKAVVGGGAKAIGKALGGAAAKEAVRTPFRGSMWQDLEERTGDQYVVRDDGTVGKEETSAAARLYKSYMSTFAEGFSEQLGNVVGGGFLAKGAGKIAPKLLGKKMGGALVNGADRLAKATKAVRNTVQRTTNYNGTFDEFGEEVVNNIIEPILTGEPERIKENFSSKNLLTTLGSVALVGSVMHSAELPSIVRHELQGGKLRKQTNQAIGAIDDMELRQGVFDALKKGQTVEQKATQLASLDWGNVSQNDAAHVVDAFSSNLRYELFKGVDQEQTAKEQYAHQYAIFNAEYQKIAHRETGIVQELLDDEGGKHYLLSGSLDDASADNTVFVLDAQTGETGQLDRNRIEHVEPPLTYGQLLNKFNAQNIEPEISEFDDVEAEAAEAGVSPVGYAQGEAVDLSDGRSGEFIGYLPDGVTARVAIEDELTGEPNTVEVSRNQIVGLAEVAEEPAAVVAPVVEQETAPVVQEPTIPLQKDGTPDYDAMSAAQFLEEYGKKYSYEEAMADLEGERELLNKQIAKTKSDSQSLDRNTRERNRSKIAELQNRLDDIVSVLGAQSEQVAQADSPSVAASIKPTWKEYRSSYGDPVSLRDYILREIGDHKKFRWKDEGSSRGLASELGFVGNENERRLRIGLLKKDGDTPERYAEHLTAEVAPQFGITDYNEVRNEVIDVLLSVNSVGQARKFVDELHGNLRKQQEAESEYGDYLQEQVNKEVYDVRAEMDKDYDRLQIEDFPSIDALFSEESLPLDRDDNIERIPQQPIPEMPEAFGYGNGGGYDFSQDQGVHVERGIATDNRGENLRQGAIGPAGSRGGGNAAESIQQPDGITQSATADLSEVRFSESNSDDTPEMDRIKSDAIERGDFMRAPNGNPTHLTERQWLQVRTAPFKEWFGDWEKAARIEKLRVAEPIAITGEEIDPSEDLKQYRRNAFEYGKQLRGSYVNQDTSETIIVSRSGLEEVLHHDAARADHLQSIAAIPQIIEKATYIASEPNTDTKVKADQFRYYVCGLKIGGVDYTVKMVVAEIDGKRYYDHALTQIEKSNLIDLIRIPSLNQDGKSALLDIKDKRLLSILQVDASKIVDENGEPLVVYHGARTANEYFSFGEESYFTDNLDTAKMFDADVSHTLLVNDVAHSIDLRSAEDIKNAVEPFEEIEWAEGWDLVEADYAIDPLIETVRAVLNMDQDIEIKSVILDPKKTPIRSLFLNIRNPQVKDYNGNTWGDVGAVIEQDIDNNGDGFIACNIREGGLAAELLDGSEPPVQNTYVAYNPHQVKSATDNTGSFNAQSDDIRFKNDAADQTLLETERQQKYETDKLSKKQSDAERRAAIDRTLQKLTREFGVETVQVDTAADLPAPLRATSKDHRFSGLYHKPSGAVYLIASKLRDADHATATYLHEVVAHKGIDGLLGQERATRFYAAVFDALKPEEQGRLLSDYKSKLRKGEAYDEQQARIISGDEVVARMAEGNVTPGTMQRIIAAVRRFFREVLGVPLTISDTDIRYILFKSKISLQRTNNLTDAMRAIEADQRMRAVVALDELRAKERAPLEQVNDQFNQELVDLQGSRLRFGHVFSLGMPSEALRLAGVPVLPIELEAVRLQKKSAQTEHPFDINAVRNLPEALAHPIAVFDSKRGTDNKVVLTELSNGEMNFVVAIQTEASTQQGREVLQINSIRSLYPKEFGRLVHWIEGGLMRWVDKPKALTFLERNRLEQKRSDDTNVARPNMSGIRRSNSADATSPDRFDPARALVEKPNELASADHSDLVGTAKIVQNFENPTFEDDIRYSEVKPLRQPIPYRVAGNKGRFGDKGRIGKAVEQIGSAAVQVQEALQDTTIKVQLLQNEVKQGGGTITPLTNVYEALNHVDSRADAAMRKYKRHFMNPIVDHIKRWRKAYGLGYDQITDYLLAKHSLERHASGINALDEKEGGKWTKEHATQQVEAVESVVPEAELAAFWADWHKATHQVLEISVRSGRMSLDEKREILGNGWQYYVPLRGKDFDFEEVADMRDVFYYEMNRGQGGASVSERIADVKAKGRSSKSADPIAMLQYMANNEISLSEQNNARRTLLRLVEAHPERTDLFSVRYKWYVKQPDGSWTGSYEKPAAELLSQTGRARALLRTEKDPAKRQELKDQITVSLREREGGQAYTGAPEDAHFVSVMKDGIRYTVELVDPEVAAAVNYKAGTVQRWASKYIGTPTRIMAQLNTSKNPAFILPNFVRDMQQAALYNLVDSEGNVKGFMTHALGSWKILDRNLRGVDRPLTVAELGMLDVTNPADRAQLIERYGKDRVNDTLYDLFAANGGETGYVHIADPKDYQRKLEKEIQTAAGGHLASQTWKGLNTGLDYMASMSENAVRYATFVSQLETGKSVFDAVSYAKNITVNFNRKGKYAKGIGALFMFFNAGIQGVDNQLSLIDNRQGKDKKTIRKQRARFVAAKAIQVALGYYSSYLLGSALSALIGDDGEEYTVSDYERRTNFIFPVGGKYVKIPIAITDRPFYALGVMVGDMLDGKMTAGDVTEEFASMFIDAYNPIQSDFIDPNDGITHLKRLIPSSLKPMFDLKFNQDFMGLPISKTKYDDYIPDSQLGLKKTAWWAKAIAKELNELGGGNMSTPAGVDANGEKGILNWLDVSPGNIEHLLGSYSGGIGRIVSDVAALIGGDTEVRRMPIVDRFVGEPYEKRPSSDYYKLKEAIEFRDRTNRKTVANGEQSAIYPQEEFEQKAKIDQEWRRYLQQSDKQIKKLREELDNAPDGSAKYDQIEKEIARKQREFIQEYNQQDHD